MARRRKSSNDTTLEFIIFAIFVVGAIILSALAFALAVTAIVAFYAFPILAGAGFFFQSKVNKRPPSIPNPALADSEQGTRIVSKLLAQRNLWREIRQEQYDKGKEHKISLTQKSGGNRFHSGSRLGRELNDLLDEADEKLRVLEETVYQVRSKVFANLPPWRREFDRWTKRRALVLSWQAALISFPILAGCSYAYWAIQTPDWLQQLQQLVMWRPGPKPAMIPLAVGTLATYGVFGIAFLVYRKKLPSLMDSNLERRWILLLLKWAPISDVDDYFEPDPSGVGSERDENKGSVDAGKSAPWQEVLGVPPGASPEEIKSAYRERIKDYHSDRVATLGQKLRDVAEEESKRINVAYDQAKTALGF